MLVSQVNALANANADGLVVYKQHCGSAILDLRPLE